MQFKMEEDAEKVLEAINIDEMLKMGVRPYLQKLGQEYLKAHKKEMQKGYDRGERFAEDVIKES